jgi:hypothetical protein
MRAMPSSGGSEISPGPQLLLLGLSRPLSVDSSFFSMRGVAFPSRNSALSLICGPTISCTANHSQ